MSHDEAIHMLAAERYLLDELDIRLREEFEEHIFECQACALDLRAGVTLLALFGSRRWQLAI